MVSCVRTIEEVLSALSPAPTAIDVSIALRSVVLQHSQGLTSFVIQATLEDEGFNVSGDVLQENSSVDVPLSSGVSQILSTSRRKHIQQCSLCQDEGPRSASDSLPTPIGKGVLPPDTIPVVGTERSEGPFRLTLSIEGMSCSSCSVTITNMVAKMDGVAEVVVSLLSKPATVIIDTKKMVNIVVETVESGGFEVDVVSVESTAGVDDDHDAAFGPRTVALRVQGMFCQ